MSYNYMNSASFNISDSNRIPACAVSNIPLVNTQSGIQVLGVQTLSILLSLIIVVL
jgi:hypothetical protein